MSLGDTPIVTIKDIVYKDIVRPTNTQNLGGGFTSGTYRAVNITDPTSDTNAIKMFYVEVSNATGNTNAGSQQIPFPGGLTFSKAYVVLEDVGPIAKLRLYLTYCSNSFLSFQIRATDNVANATTSFLVIGV